MPTCKKVKFQYAVLVYEDEHGIEHTFDFETWLDTMKAVPYEKRVRRVHTNFMRLENSQSKDERDGLIGLNFLRLRDNNIPMRVPVKDAAEDLDIGDDEYVGEGLHIVYDTNTCYFMIQINRFSVSLNSIAAYINQTNPNIDQVVYFKSFHKNMDPANLKFGRYKMIEIGLANVGEIERTGPMGLIGKAIDAAQDYEGHSVKICISVGKMRKKTLKNSAIEETLKTIPELRDVISTAKLTYCEGDMEKGEELNLLDLLEYSILSLEIKDRKPLEFEYTIKNMKQEYLNKKARLDRMQNKY